MNQLSRTEGGYESRLRANIVRLGCWNGAWLAASALMAFGPKFLWNRAFGVTLLAVAVDIAIGIGMILATKKYVMDLDELHQKVYLNALGVTMGVGLIAAVPYSVMGSYGMMPFKTDSAYLFMLMALTFLVSILYGTWRYR